MRPFTDLMVQLKQSGLQLYVTRGILEEIERHLNLCKTYIKTRPWKGRVPYVFQRYALAGKPAAKFDSWLEYFLGDMMPMQDLADFLAESAGIQVADAPMHDKIPANVVEEVQEYWQTVQDRRRNVQDTFSIAANRLASHDSENFIAVLSQRNKEVGKSILGYTSWLVTLDSAAWNLINKVSPEAREYIQHSPVISLDFLIKYLSFGPRREKLTNRDDGHARIFSTSIFESVSPELIEAAKEVRAAYGHMEERQMQRHIRDTLNKQRLKLGVLQDAGLDGIDSVFQTLH